MTGLPPFPRYPVLALPLQFGLIEKDKVTRSLASTIGSIIVDGRMYPPPTNNYGNGGGSNGSANAAAPPAPRHYTSPPGPPPYHNRVSPLQGLAQMPTQLQQRAVHRGNHQPVIKSQPSGTVHHAHQQVTSSTHPYNNSHHEANLRGLLAHHSYHHQNGYRATSPQASVAGPSMPLYRMAGTGTGQLPPPLPPHTASQRYVHGYTQQQPGQGQVSTPHNSRQHAAYSPAARQLVQRVQSPHSSNQQTGGGIQWHIPQQPPAQYGSPSPVHKPLPQVHAPPDDSYKITLKQPTPPAVVDQKPVLTHPPFVSSSVPKTPSPHTQAKAADDAEKSLDKFCQESVNDLMMTIAKLDSNGIMVIPEKGADSVVDSSTGPPIDRPSTSTAGTSQATPSSQGMSVSH
ncbi:hypothetical protein J6590_007141 [Homalodisca vitripennis]|nr:hypothetical protein J6590_007141 [Homalodisca vitripennis]